MTNERIAMKQCPICKSISFDDVTICYGCMYDFFQTKASKGHGAFEHTDQVILHDSEDPFDLYDIEEAVITSSECTQDKTNVAVQESSSVTTYAPPGSSLRYDSSNDDRGEQILVGDTNLSLEIPMLTLVQKPDAPVQLLTIIDKQGKVSYLPML